MAIEFVDDVANDNAGFLRNGTAVYSGNQDAGSIGLFCGCSDGNTFDAKSVLKRCVGGVRFNDRNRVRGFVDLGEQAGDLSGRQFAGIIGP